jgi:DNA-directed RNA polymerase beta' subunit
MIYPEIIPELSKNIQKNYYSTLIEAGECVGILTAQSIGEKQTQTNLNNFHKAGSSDNNNVGIVSKFSELLNATKDPKIQNCNIFFKNGNSTVEELRDTIGHSLLELTMQTITKNVEIYLNKEDELWYNGYELIYNDNFRQYTDCISVEIDMDKLFTYKLTLEEISEIIEEDYSDISCVFSPDNIGKLDVFVNTSSIDIEEDRVAFVNQDNIRQVYLEEVVLPIFSKIHIAGIPGIESMYFIKDNKTNGWMVETECTIITKLPLQRLSSILAHPDVDMKRVVSNNIWDIYHIFGIEAARQFMINQFMNIMPGINLSHTILLVDRMTFLGTISSISRYTMRKDDASVFSKCSFEETLDNFIRAALYGQEEPAKGVSASVICGKKANIGSGMCSLRMDLSVLPPSKGLPEVLKNDVIEKA